MLVRAVFESGGSNERDRPAKQARSIILSGTASVPGFGLHPEGRFDRLRLVSILAV
jgi:hypothetical protein